MACKHQVDKLLDGKRIVLRELTLEFSMDVLFKMKTLHLRTILKIVDFFTSEKLVFRFYHPFKKMVEGISVVKQQYSLLLTVSDNMFHNFIPISLENLSQLVTQNLISKSQFFEKRYLSGFVFQPAIQSGEILSKEVIEKTLSTFQRNRIFLQVLCVLLFFSCFLSLLFELLKPSTIFWESSIFRASSSEIVLQSSLSSIRDS